MFRLVLRRILISIPLLVIVSLITFVLEAFVPGDPARTLLGVNATAAQYQQVRDQLHLDQPVLVQYWIYLQGVFHGDLGSSIFTGDSVTSTLVQRLPVSLSVILLSTLLAVIIGIVLGVVSATGRPWVRRIVDVIAPIGFALPNFWVGLVLAAIFAVAIPLFPATGYTPFSEAPSGWLLGLILPVVALALASIASIAKVCRDGMSAALEREYVRTLRACGVSEASIVWRHALRNTAPQLLTVTANSLIGALSGTVLVETVFVLPGLGSLAVSATNTHDIPVVQGIALIFTLLVVIVNLLTDIAYGFIDPRVRVA